MEQEQQLLRMEGTIEHLIYENRDTGYVVFEVNAGGERAALGRQHRAAFAAGAQQQEYRQQQRRGGPCSVEGMPCSFHF